MHALARPPSEDIATTSLWAVLMRSWLRVLIVSGLVGALTFGALSLTQQYYAAAVQVRAASVATVAEALRSRGVAETLTGSWNSRNLPPSIVRWRRTESPTGCCGRSVSASHDRARRPSRRCLRPISGSLRVYPSRDARAVTIEFASPSPEMSIRAVSRLAALYLASVAGEGGGPVAPVDTSPLAQGDRGPRARRGCRRGGGHAGAENGQRIARGTERGHRGPAGRRPRGGRGAGATRA